MVRSAVRNTELLNTAAPAADADATNQCYNYYVRVSHHRFRRPEKVGSDSTDSTMCFAVFERNIPRLETRGVEGLEFLSKPTSGSLQTALQGKVWRNYVHYTIRASVACCTARVLLEFHRIRVFTRKEHS